jgi:Tfp pilus assembly protein PilV
MLRSAGRSSTDRSPISPGPRSIARGGHAPGLRSDEGFLLIEVIVSALLVGIIVIATLTGFDVVNRTSADQRQRNEAALLAAQSQEQLRTEPASALQALKAAPHSYAQTFGGTTYTVKQTAELQGSGGSSSACSVTESERQSGNGFRITSTVSWPQQQKSSRGSLVVSSVVTPPTGSGLEVDAYNTPTPTAGVQGITAIAKFTPVTSSTVVTLEETTPAEGCVVFGGIPATQATVEIRELAGYVTRNGSTKVEPKLVKIAPNFTTHYAIVYNKGGRVEAKFQYKGSPTYTHKNNLGAEETENVTGDTFVAGNALMEKPAPDYEVGSTSFAGSTTPLTGKFEATAYSPLNLFPFGEKETPWTVYAGDCLENEPSKVTGATVKPPPNQVVPPGGTSHAPVPMSHVGLNLYTNAKVAKTEVLSTATAYPVTITNSKCAGVTPNNEVTVNTKHIQETTKGAANGGHLMDPFQPFANEMELCVAAAGKTYSHKVETKTEEGYNLSIWLGQKSTQEKEANRTAAIAKEAETKAAREKTEREPREAREKTEKTNREAAEKAESEKKLPAAYSAATTYALEALVSEAGKLYKSRKAANKGHTPKTTAEWWKEITRGEAEAKRKAEETATREAAEKAEETEKKPGREAKEAEEAAVKSARETNEKAEATELTETGVTVETSASCP